jgi:hypothetical protein
MDMSFPSNSDRYEQLISQIEDDLVKMKTQAPVNESHAHAEGKCTYLSIY